MKDLTQSLKCPYCGQEMELGRILNLPQAVAYWWPGEHPVCTWGSFTADQLRKDIENGNGILLDQPSALRFHSEKQSHSYCCRSCKILITKLD